MPINVNRLLRGGASGAAAGSVFGPLGTAIGGGVGALASLFGGESDEDELARRLKEYLEGLDEKEETTIREGVGALERSTARGIRQAGSRGERLARSMGRSTDAEAYRLPLQGKVAEAGAGGIRDFMRDTKGFFNQARIQAEGEYAGRPLDLDDDILDTLDILGGAGLKYKQGSDLLKILSGADPGGIDQGKDGRTSSDLTPVRGLSKRVTDGYLPSMEDPMSLLRRIYGGG